MSVFELSDIAELYSKYGLVYPDGVYDLIDKHLSESLPPTLQGSEKKWNLALDVGCGAGQGTGSLCKYFEKVIGIDSSATQISYATKCHGNDHPGCMSFICHDATQLSKIFEESSVDLIVVCQALHWINRTKFYEECKKILKPGALLVSFGSGILWLEDDRADKIRAELFYPGVLKAWADPAMSHLEDCYARIYPEILELFPLSIRDDSMVVTTKSSLEDFVKYLGLWSAYKNYCKGNPDKEDILVTIYNRLKDLYQDVQNIVIERKANVFVIITRNE